MSDNVVMKSAGQARKLKAVAVVVCVVCAVILAGWAWHALQVRRAQNKLASTGSAGSQVIEPTASDQKAVDDTTKKTIDDIAADIKKYFVAHSAYPSESQVYDAAWRANNLADVSPDMTAPLVTQKGTGTYHYTALPKNCGKSTPCQHFTLSAELGEGATYSRTDTSN